MNRDTIEMLNRVQRRGLSLDDALAVRRIAMTLTRWYELECGDGNDYQSWGIERDETTDKPYMVRYPELDYYLQIDPRGASLYLFRKDDLAGRAIDSCYSSVGVAVYQ